MTDRHIHCVYFQYKNPNERGYCLLKCKNIEYGFEPHCENYILKPEILLSYFLVHEKYYDDWFDADQKALEYIERVGWNTYPKVIK